MSTTRVPPPSRSASPLSVPAPAALAPRLAARGRVRRRTRLLVTVGVVLALVVVGAAGWLLLATSVLGVGQVEVLGVHRLSAAEVRAAGAVPGGRPLARLDPGAIAARIAALPQVRHVVVTRSWPSTVRITVQERVPAGVLLRGPTYVLIDLDGVAFGEVSRRPRGLPLVTAPVEAGQGSLRAALQVLRRLPPAVRAQVRQARAAGPDQVELQLSRGRTVRWGSSERSERKAAVLTVLLSRKARIYDVSAPDAPTTTR